ncbi:MAG TPA: family 16 glycoside hydrolase [Longimicrobium sp.]|nr:family 16 glycoside hydrolase [Longimicrobium sp.]
MPTSSTPQTTDFSRDILGRYVCNGLDEALRSADPATSPAARPFDIIVIGGGTFGAGVAQHAFFRGGNHRILVLEGGPLALPEHVQNLPAIGVNAAGPTSIQALRDQGAFGPDKPRNEVWGLPWHSPTPFSGLAYCVGGRSVFWGGWSPRPLSSELPAARWPAAVLQDLTVAGGDFDKAASQIGVTETNDFIFGPLHEVLRKRLFDGIKAGGVRSAVPIAQLPDGPIEGKPGDKDLAKLEAPLAVQGRAPRSGYFPMNKFSTVPLLMRAARMAFQESNGDDTQKRLMVVPNCHVVRLVQDGGRVTAVETNRGTVTVQPQGVVVVALGTIESTRLVLSSFPQIAAQGNAGKNLIAHLRSNLTIRVPRSSLAELPTDVKELQASALFVKGRHDFPGGAQGHFHLQVTAAGLGPKDADSEAEMWKKIPDIDHYDRFLLADDSHAVITLRGIGEMESENPSSRVFLDSEPDEFGVPRAHVTIAPSARDRALWDVMDGAADDGALALAGGKPYDVLVGGVWKPVAAGQPAASVFPFAGRRDGLGTTHHEAGTLRIGEGADAPADSNGRLRGTVNAYVAGPALFPTVGSPNPMLTGLALGRRLARHLVPPKTALVGGALFDGASMDGWIEVGRSRFAVVGGVLRSIGGDELGLLYSARPAPAEFVLELEWRAWTEDANSGVFVRFPDPGSKHYNNPAYVAVHFGFEVQIDELGAPDGAGIHKTGAIYGEPSQVRTPVAAKPLGEWNKFTIQVLGQTYTVSLNGKKVTEFTNTNAGRGAPTTASAPAHIGLQAYPAKTVDFRNIVLRELVPAPPGPVATPSAGQIPATR